MAKRSGALAAGAAALKAFFTKIGIALPLLLAYALIVTSIDLFAYDRLLPNGEIPDQQDLLRVFGWLTGIVMGTEILLGPVVSAFAIYIGRASVTGAKGSLYQAVNFALTRYSRMFLPHLAAQLSIQLGMIIIIPGVLFQLQYAFVDAVTALEEEKHPLNRSKRLTRGRRRSLFLLFLPVLLMMQGILFLDLWAYTQSAVVFFAVKAVALALPFVMQIGFYILYEERTRKRKPRPKPAPTPDAQTS
ncbi:MAG: hypothetical protein AAFV53_00780 [Myxococcota bacterium]